MRWEVATPGPISRSRPLIRKKWIMARTPLCATMEPLNTLAVAPGRVHA